METMVPIKLASLRGWALSLFRIYDVRGFYMQCFPSCDGDFLKDRYKVNIEAQIKALVKRIAITFVPIDG